MIEARKKSAMNPLIDNHVSDDEIERMQSELIRAKQARLLDYAIAGRWDMVESLYQEDSSFKRVKLRSSEDTVLHMAVSERRGDVVTKLLGYSVRDDDVKKILELTNAKGDTPLHLAAARGMVKTCELMTEKHPDLIKFRNHEGENPLFVAAFHGTKDAFICLHNKLQSSIPEARQASGHDDLDTVRSGHDFTAAGSAFAVHFGRNDGKTILHCTISREYFDLAIQIIQLHPYLIERRDHKGYLALHYLAEKPFAFRSGTSLGVVETIIYNCVWFDPLENKDSRKLDGSRAPDNYKTCLDFLLLVVQLFMLFVSRFKCWFQSATGDIHKENLQSGISVHEESGPCTSLDIQSSGEHPKSNGEDHHATVTPFERLKYCIWFLLKCLFIIIVRFECVNVIIRKKRKHILACRTVDKLLQHSDSCSYDNDGMNPNDTILAEVSHLGDERMSPRLQREPVNEMADRGSPPDVGNQQKKGPIKIYKESQNVLLEFDGTPLKVAVTILGEDKSPEGMMVHRGHPRSLSHGEDNPQEHVEDNPQEQQGTVVLLAKSSGQDKSPKEKTDELYITPFLLAVENGVIEMVTRILPQVPTAIYDQKTSDKKNALLLAVQKRQIEVYDFLRTKFESRSEILGKVDKNGDNVLHIAASSAKQAPQQIPGDTMRMLWEMKWYQAQWQTKWYEYVKDSMPLYFFENHNESQKTPQEIFTDTLKQQLENKDGDRWLEATSGACSVVAGLIATVAFPSFTTVPGDYDNGVPTLRRHDAFRVYIISSFLALCFSLTSIITFLNILISGFQKSDYSKSLGQKLLVGLTSLYLSLGSMLVSFFAGHVLMLKGKTVHWCLPIYAVGLLPVIIISVMQVNLYFNLLHCVFGRRPQPSYRGFSL